MTSVNPPPLKTPKAFLKDAEVAGWIKELTTIIRQLWARTGGNDDFIEGSITFTSISDGVNSALIQRVDELDRRLAYINARMIQMQAFMDAQARRERPAQNSEDAIKLAVLKHG